MSFFDDYQEMAEEMGMRPFDGSMEMIEEINDKVACGDLDDDDPYGKKEGQRRKAENRVSSANILTEKGVQFTSNNNGAHLQIIHGGKAADFWPGTEKYVIKNNPSERVYDKARYKRGVFNLLKDLGVE